MILVQYKSPETDLIFLHRFFPTRHVDPLNCLNCLNSLNSSQYGITVNDNTKRACKMDSRRHAPPSPPAPAPRSRACSSSSSTSLLPLLYREGVYKYGHGFGYHDTPSIIPNKGSGGKKVALQPREVHALRAAAAQYPWLITSTVWLFRTKRPLFLVVALVCFGR